MRVTRKEWYRRVNSEWPEQVPPLTAEEAERAARRLYRFVARETFTGQVDITGGRRRNRATRYRIVVNPENGWKNLVHDLSHWLYRGPHGGQHARVERRMIREVLKRGWLEGKLKSEPKEEPSIQEERRESIERRIKRWEMKAKRVKTALAKLYRQRRYYERIGPGNRTRTCTGR